jgi:hypothetical protein
MYGTWRTSSMILRLCPAPTTAWDIRNLRRCRNSLNALEIIPSSSARSDLRSSYEKTLPVE